MSRGRREQWTYVVDQMPPRGRQGRTDMQMQMIPRAAARRALLPAKTLRRATLTRVTRTYVSDAPTKKGSESKNASVSNIILQTRLF